MVVEVEGEDVATLWPSIVLFVPSAHIALRRRASTGYKAKVSLFVRLIRQARNIIPPSPGNAPRTTLRRVGPDLRISQLSFAHEQLLLLLYCSFQYVVGQIWNIRNTTMLDLSGSSLTHLRLSG